MPVYKAKVNKTDPDEMSKIEEMKYGRKYDKYLARVEKVEGQLKQAFSKYYGQIDRDMKASLKEDKDFVRAFNKKDVIALRKMLRNVNFNYKKMRNQLRLSSPPTEI